MGANRPLEPITLLISAVLAAPRSQLSSLAARPHQLGAADWPMTNTSGTGAAGAEKVQQMPLFLLSPNPPLQVGWALLPRGNMLPLAHHSLASRRALGIPDPKGEVERWRGEDLPFREVVGLWPCRTAPHLLPSASNSAHIIA